MYIVLFLYSVENINLINCFNIDGRARNEGTERTSEI